MARLRRLSTEDAASGSDDEFCPQSTDLSEHPLPKTRSSPRKKPSAQYRQCADSEDEKFRLDVENAFLRPKTVFQNPGNKKRIQLSSLRPLTAFNIPPIDLELSKDTRRSKHGLKVLKTDVLNSSEPVANRNLICEEKPKGQCSSDDDSEESEEELPSPREFLGLPRKPQTKFPKVPTNAIDLTKAVENLSLDSRSTLSNDRLQTSRRADTDVNSSQREESEGEDPTAFLRFSPPRFKSPSRINRSPLRPVTPPPQSPSKSRLQSPSKNKPKIPSPHLRESLDAFWDANTINHWNDQYSPQKPLRSPKKLKFLPSSDDQKSPTSSPKKAKSPTKRSKAELEQRKEFDARKCEIAVAFLAELDSQVADGRIQELSKSTGGVRFVWSKTLNSTAGRANWRRETTKTRQPDGSMSQTSKHHASIELAEKVINDEHRLLNVIAHEFCHLCNFMISGIKDQPHGAQFKVWGRECTAAFGHRGVEVTTKHSYEIDYKYVWQCSNAECGVEFRRHSKSIDPKRHTCGSCHSKIVQIKPVPRKEADGATGGYAAYVKEHFANTKKAMPGASHKEVMEAIGRKYRSEKASTKASSGVVDLDGTVSAGSTLTSEPTETVDSVVRELEFVTLDD